MDLGTLINTPQNDDGVQLPDSYHEILEVATNNGGNPKSDKEIIAKVVEDSKESPSVWFVNFPDRAALEPQAVLRDYILVWRRTVYNNPKISDDNKPESKAARRSFLVQVATKHMRLTPWHVLPLKMAARALLNLKRLGMSADHSVTKEVNCKVTEFHTELIAARPNSILLFPLHDRKQPPMLW
ncbi:hypothetical protein ACHAPF_010300 [Botrytis cinerea]